MVIGRKRRRGVIEIAGGNAPVLGYEKRNLFSFQGSERVIVMIFDEKNVNYMTLYVPVHAPVVLMVKTETEEISQEMCSPVIVLLMYIGMIAADNGLTLRIDKNEERTLYKWEKPKRTL